ncbi:sigma-54-dependent Fis family transcriptional regulator [Desulfovibrio sp. 1188_IL3213]
MTSQTEKKLGPRASLARIREAWKALALDREVQTAFLRPEIAASWQRCLNLAVNPYESSSSFVQKTEGVMAKNKLLLSAAASHLRQLHDLLFGKEYLVMLYSNDGYILDLLGASGPKRLAEQLSVFPGARHSEVGIGTFAPGICLAEKRPVQVRMCEHYREVYHDWSCTAAPIFSPQGDLQGVLDITTVGGRHPSQLLNLVRLTAGAIEAELGYRAQSSANRKLRTQFFTLMQSSAEALIVVDNDDVLTHVSPRGLKLLGVKDDKVIGRDIHTLVSNYASVRQGVKVGRELAELHFFSASSNPLVVEACLRSAGDAKGACGGIVGVLRRKADEPDQGGKVRYGFQDIIWQSKIMRGVIDDARKIAATEHTVLIQGESGTGKEMLAQAMHQASGRRSGPFVAVNCAALSSELLQSELFGYEGGAFTGADKAGKKGKFEQAQGGTIFLDEIGDMPFAAQVNLLRVLQEKSVTRVGGERVRPLDIRVMAATNVPLLQAVESGRFRNDLYYRLSVISLRVPPLRKRKDDLVPLLEFMVDNYANEHGLPGGIAFGPEVMAALYAHDWPGNVRELENVIISTLTKMRGSAPTLADLPQSLQGGAETASGSACCLQSLPLDLRSLELETIGAALEKCGGHMGKAAALLGINRVTLYRKLKKRKTCQ